MRNWNKTLFTQAGGGVHKVSLIGAAPKGLQAPEGVQLVEKLGNLPACHLLFGFVSKFGDRGKKKNGKGILLALKLPSLPKQDTARAERPPRKLRFQQRRALPVEPKDHLGDLASGAWPACMWQTAQLQELEVLLLGTSGKLTKPGILHSSPKS